MRVQIDRFEGINGFIAKEQAPTYLFTELVNWEISQEVGKLIKRKPYDEIITAESEIKNLIEFRDLNGSFHLVGAIFDDINSLFKPNYFTWGGSSYGSKNSFSNDERTTGSTISSFYPKEVNQEIRSGCGITDSTDLPLWIGYIKDRKRYYNPSAGTHDTEFTNGLYLDDQIYDDKLQVLLEGYKDLTAGLFVTPGLESHVSDGGFSEEINIQVIPVPVIDGYQRGIPDNNIGCYVSDYSPAYDRWAFNIQLWIANANKAKAKRITHIDLFIRSAKKGEALNDTLPAYFLERIPLQGMGQPWLEKQGDIITGDFLEIEDYEEWFTFDRQQFWVHDVDEDRWHLADGAGTPNGTKIRIYIGGYGDTPIIGTSKKFQFYNGWYKPNAGSNCFYQTFYDDYYKRLGSEMYTYLGLPAGDYGREDKRYKHYTWNGSRAMIAGTPDTGAYFSTAFDPDVFPSQNRIRPRRDVTALESISRDFILFSKDGMERVTINSNEDWSQEDIFGDRGAFGPESVLKVNNYQIFGCDYKGPWMLNGRDFIDIGLHVKKYFDPREGIFTDAQKEGVRIGYNRINEQILFSFPDYTSSDYPDGIILVYDIRAGRMGFESPWFIIRTDKTIKGFVTNNIYHLLGWDIEPIDTDFNDSDLIDFNGDGEETLDTLIKLRIFENPLIHTQIDWRVIRIRYDGNDDLTVNIYFDGEVTASKSFTLGSDELARIFKPGRSIEVEITSESSVNDMQIWLIHMNGNPKVL